MIRTSALLSLAALSACSPDAPTPVASPGPTPSAPVASPGRSTPTARPTASNRLPDAVVGRWAVSPDQCRAGAELGITVEPSRIRFYESVAEITRVTPADDGVLGIDAQVSGEGERAARSFDLKLLDGGARLLRMQAPFPDITYLRCETT